ncbi:MAG: hypothetical protein JWL66_1666 [Sphingomonadales bacterium]|jgi:hypothetical protein|nr:hypothetical protein [Sphingomonadales bacterium]
MSDIAIRFDGIFLAGFFVLAASAYFMVAIITLALNLWTKASPLFLPRVTRTALLFASFSLAGLTATVACMASTEMSVAGPDWLDWLTLPSIFLFSLGCVKLARREPGAVNKG